MDKQTWEKVNTIIDDALDLEPGDERKNFIRQQCDSHLLQEEVLGFLQSIEESGGWWEKLKESNLVLSENITNENRSLQNSTNSVPNLGKPNTDLPQKIGSYFIKEIIARGGMGEVYLAERINEDFHKKVALKIIRNEITSHEQAARFERERMILSSLNHPNIGQLLDGGISDDGRSYFVMEYVDGMPITTFCQQNSCDLQNILKLFRQLCEAVQYAHSNFIVHRDLKPDNLFVTPQGNIKVLDFGIAKILNDDVSANQLEKTSSGRQILTYKYAAPEQLTSDPITTATDVYSLGILLFELLTGRHPFRFKEKSYTEIEHAIRNEVPPVPAQTDADSENLSDSELDSIVLKALNKNPADRYQSAQHMLDDIIRYQENKPVLARDGKTLYRSFKFLKRNSVPFLSAAAIVLSGFLFLYFYTSEIKTEREIAQWQAQKAEQATAILIDLFEANQPGQTEAGNFTVNSLLELGESKANNLEGFPELKGTMYSVIGQIYRNIGEFGKADHLLNASVDVFTNHYGDTHIETINAKDHYGLLLINRGEFDRADSILTHNLQIRRQHFSDNPVALAQSLNYLALANRRKGNFNEAERLYRQSYELRSDNLGAEHPLTLESLSSLTVTLHNKGRYDQAESLYRDLIEKRRRVLGPNHPDYATNLSSLGALLMNIGEYDEANSFLTQALEIRSAQLGEDHPVVAITLNNLGMLNKDIGRFQESERYFKRALEIREAALGENHVNTAITYFCLADLMLKKKEHNTALTYLQNGQAIFRNNLPEDHSFVVRSDLRLGSIYADMNELAKADSIMPGAYETLKKIHDSNSIEIALGSIRYGEFLIKSGKTEQAKVVLTDGLNILKSFENNSSPRQNYVTTLLQSI
jgi:serine/threonine-protein kinase